MKELIISLIIIVTISAGNKVTQDYTKYCVENTSKTLIDLKNNIINYNNTDYLKKEINDIHEQWDKKYEKLAYYIEHDELEKVETNLTLLRSYIEMKENGEAVAKLEETIFILRHIEDKNKFDLENIF